MEHLQALIDFDLKLKGRRVHYKAVVDGSTKKTTRAVENRPWRCWQMKKKPATIEVEDQLPNNAKREKKFRGETRFIIFHVACLFLQVHLINFAMVLTYKY